jgi:DNA polymerase-3 subunit epsilon
LRKCRGACTGAEPAARHQARLEAALASLKVKTWPYDGAIGLIETNARGGQDVHVVRNWCYLGTAHSENEIWSLLNEIPERPAFDQDTYKILTQALSKKNVKVRRLQHEAAAA